MMTALAPGIADDGGGGLCIDLAAVLRAHGYADTPENQARLLVAARAIGLLLCEAATGLQPNDSI